MSVGRRVLMLLQNSPYPQDGRVRREATALTSAGYEVTVISPARTGQPLHEVVDGVRVLRYPAPRPADSTLGYVWEYGVALAASWLISLYALARYGFDVVHAHNPPDLFVLVATPYKLLGKRFVFDHHDLAPEMYLARFGGGGERWLQRALLFFERLTFRAADHVISTNESYARVAVERGGVPPERVTVVRNGPETERFRPVTPDPRLRALGKTVIGYVGEMGVQDGIDYLLRALARLRDDLGRTDFHAVLVGTGTDRPRLMALARELGLEPYVEFPGRVPFADLLRYLSSADVCVCPDPRNEFTDVSTMIKLTEYLALGKPVVAFDLREHRVTAGEAALYAEPNDELDLARQLARLMGDPDLRQRMGQAGRARLEAGLTWAHSVPHLLAAYDRLVGAGRPAARAGGEGQRRAAYDLVGSGPVLPSAEEAAVAGAVGEERAR